MSELPKVFCLMGPTAAGKTGIALEWARKHPIDIISVDSALIYRGMDIGTAKPDKIVLNQITHELIDIRDPAESYSVAEFCKDALQCIEKSLIKQRIPLLVGGTMLYFKGLQEGLSVLPSSDSIIRERLQIQLNEKGLPFMFERLENCDPTIALKIKPTDSQRILRALEVYEITNIPLSTLQQDKPLLPPYQFVNIGILPKERKILHEHIEQRFHQMMTMGFIEEVESLKRRDDLNLSLPSMRAVGYRQVWEYLDGQYDKKEMLERGIAATRQLAKRQLTWLRAWKNLALYDPELNYFSHF